MRASRRKFLPNLFYKNILDKESGIVYRIRVSAAGLRTLKKKGVI
jgi:ribosomal protein L28